MNQGRLSTGCLTPNWLGKMFSKMICYIRNHLQTIGKRAQQGWPMEFSSEQMALQAHVGRWWLPQTCRMTERHPQTQRKRCIINFWHEQQEGRQLSPYLPIPPSPILTSPDMANIASFYHQRQGDAPDLWKALQTQHHASMLAKPNAQLPYPHPQNEPETTNTSSSWSSLRTELCTLEKHTCGCSLGNIKNSWKDL